MISNARTAVLASFSGLRRPEFLDFDIQYLWTGLLVLHCQHRFKVAMSPSSISMIYTFVKIACNGRWPCEIISVVRRPKQNSNCSSHRLGDPFWLIFCDMESPFGVVQITPRKWLPICTAGAAVLAPFSGLDDRDFLIFEINYLGTGWLFFQSEHRFGITVCRSSTLMIQVFEFYFPKPKKMVIIFSIRLHFDWAVTTSHNRHAYRWPCPCLRLDRPQVVR
jgi:hypothetical protein